MESQFRSSLDVGMPPHGVAGSGGGDPSSNMHLPRSVLRIVALVLAFVSAVVMGAAKETVILFVTDPTTGFTSSYTGVYKSTYSAAYVYFVVANALVFVYSLVALVVSMAKRGSFGGAVAVPLAVADLVMVAFLFSGNGAAAAISVVSEKGQTNFGGWEKICDVASKFCARANAAVVLSMVASLCYVLLVVLGVITIHKMRS